MKSSLTYDMHNYAAKSSPNILDSKIIMDGNLKNYSLRQRQKRLRNTIEDSMEYNSDVSNNDNDSLVYGNCFEMEKPKKCSKKRDNSNSNANKPKTKAAPLSKYRRKTANARERTRMREINMAFENLRYCVPNALTGEEAGTTNEKLTKITTLRLAMKYIRILNEALANPSFEADFIRECQKDGDHRFTTANWQRPPIPSRQQTDESNEEMDSDVKSPNVKNTKNTKALNAKNGKVKRDNAAVKKQTANHKRTSKKQKMNFTSNQYSYSPLHSCNESNSTSTSAYASFSSSATESPISNGYATNNSNSLPAASHTMSDFGSLVLDSDGESLHLSDQCLSPKNFGNLLEDNAKINDGLSGYDLNSNMISMENPLELSLRLLEPASSADSLEFSGEPQPPSCISPLVTMDPFNPFGDLLHSDYVEQNSLDMFLT